MKAKHPKSIKEPNPPPQASTPALLLQQQPLKVRRGHYLSSAQNKELWVKLCSDKLSATLYTNFLHFTVILTELKTIKYPDFYTSVWRMKIDAGSYMSR